MVVGINLMLLSGRSLLTIWRETERQRVLCQSEQPLGRDKLFQSAAPDRSQTVLPGWRWEVGGIIIELSHQKFTTPHHTTPDYTRLHQTTQDQTNAKTVEAKSL